MSTDYDTRPIDPDLDDPYTSRGKTPAQILAAAQHFSKRYAQEVTEKRRIKRELADAQERASADAAKFLEMEQVLGLAADYLGQTEQSPGKDWWKRYFLLTGAHMIRTEEGWEPGSGKPEYEATAAEDGFPIEETILDEVNPPSLI